MDIKYGIVRDGTYAGIPAYNVFAGHGDLDSDGVVNAMRDYPTHQKTVVVIHEEPSRVDELIGLVSNIREHFNALIILSTYYPPTRLWGVVNWVTYYGDLDLLPFQGNDIILSVTDTHTSINISPVGNPTVWLKQTEDGPDYAEILAMTRTMRYPVRIIRWVG
jgi:hypothetical protein